MKKYSTLLVIPLILVAGLFFLIYRFGHNDAKAIAEFSAAYENYDKAISDYSKPVFALNHEGAPAADDLERQADEALAELNIKASARISSLTKNDGTIMSTTAEIADLSGKELDALKAYERTAADQNSDLEKLAKEFGNLTNERKTAYAHFRELGGPTN